MPLGLDVSQLMHEYFIPPQMKPEELVDVYGAADQKPYFFKAVQVVSDEPTIARLEQAEAKRFAERLTAIIESDKQRTAWAEADRRGQLDAAAKQARELDEARRAEIQPHWLRWENPRHDGRSAGSKTGRRPDHRRTGRAMGSQNQAADAGLVRQPPAVHRGTPSRQRPDHVSRQRPVGDARSGWNTLALTPAALMYDRLVCSSPWRRRTGQRPGRTASAMHSKPATKTPTRGRCQAWSARDHATFVRYVGGAHPNRHQPWPCCGGVPWSHCPLSNMTVLPRTFARSGARVGDVALRV